MTEPTQQTLRSQPEPADGPAQPRRRLLQAAAASALPAIGGLVLPGSAHAQAAAWPSKPIRIVVPFPPGGLTDSLARNYGEHLAKKFGQPVVIDNKPGGGGIIGADAVAKAAPDGHTLLLSVSGTYWQSRVLYRKLPFDVDRDFVPITMFPSGPLAFGVPEKLPVKNVKEFVEFARKNPANMGTYAPGSMPHMAADSLNQAQGLSIITVHYRGEAPMWSDVSTGQIQAGIGSVQGAQSHVQRGAMRIIAVTGTQRSPKLPDVPTCFEQGFTLPVFKLDGYLPLAAPTGTPVEILEKISEAIREAYTTPKIKELHQFQGIPTPPTPTLADTRRQWNEDAPQWIALADRLGIKLD